ncbi:MAG: amino acid ABC transporter permease [Mesorhizobium sp.]
MNDEHEFVTVSKSHPWRWIAGIFSIAVTAWLIFHVGNNDSFHFATVPEFLLDPRILDGLKLTIYVTCGSMLIGLVLGVVLAIMGLSANPVTNIIASAFIWLFRGTPVLVQLIFWFNIGIIFPNLSLSLPGGNILFSMPMNTIMTAVVTALIGLGLNEAAYMSEIVRAGIQSIDKGQVEAAKALGLPPFKVMARIVFPQAMRLIVPPIGNQFISLLKTSSLVSVISAGDLLTQATRIYSENFRILELLVVASIWYLVLTTIANIGQWFIERRYSRDLHAEKSNRWRSAINVLRPSFRKGNASSAERLQ